MQTLTLKYLGALRNFGKLRNGAIIGIGVLGRFCKIGVVGECRKSEPLIDH